MYIRSQSLAQRVKAFGIDHPDTVKQWKKLNTEYNVAAMKLLQTDDFETVYTIYALCVRAFSNISCAPVLPSKNCDISSISMPLPCS
jgi:hypothetical protein